jgi:hypothetical protein
MTALHLYLFALLWLGIMYLLNGVIAKKIKKVDIKMALLYFCTVAAIGVFGEIFLDSIYNYFVGNPLWEYKILPIHHAYTSMYAPVIWGIYGFHLYLLHDTFEKKWSFTKTRYLALVFSVEALLFEALLTTSSKFLLGDFMYYYFPGDLWHVSSFQNLPFYFICGVIIIQTMRRFKKYPVFFMLMCVFLTSVVVFFDQ